MELTFIQKVVVWALPVLFAVTVHEVAHGWMASRLGDKTAQILGRLTLNPLKHIDPIGTIIVPLLLLWVAGGRVIFGWAKPVPISPRNFKHRRRDMALVALAGPVSNFIMSILWGIIGLIGRIAVSHGMTYLYPIMKMGEAGIIINWLLMVINLIPIPPLDGSRVVSNLLPPKIAYHYDKIEPYGFFILVLIMLLGLLQFILVPAWIVMELFFHAIGLL